MYKNGNKIIFDETELRRLKELCASNVPQKDISSEFGVSVDTIRRVCKENDISTGTVRKKLVDESYFNRIDSAQKAYYLGLIYADGCIYSNDKNGSYVLTLTVTESDAELVVGLKTALNSEHKIRKVEPSVFDGKVSKPKVSISIPSKKVYESLKRLGVQGCKSLKLKKPNIRKEFYGDFVRGYFDGDGSVFFYKNKSKKECRATLIGSTAFMKWIKEILPLDVRLYRDKRTTGIYYINVQRNNSLIKFHNFIYTGCSSYLNRKKLKFDEVIHYINGAPETEMAPSSRISQEDDTVRSQMKI